MAGWTGRVSQRWGWASRPDEPVADFELSGDGARLATVSGLSGLGRFAIGPATIRTWDLESAGIPRSLATVRHDAYVGMRFAADGTYVISGASDRRLLFWNPVTGAVIAAIGDALELNAFDVAWPAGALRVLVRRSDGKSGTVYLYSIREDQLAEERNWPAGPTGPVLIDARGWIAFSSDDALHVFDARTGCQAFRFVHEGLSGGIAASHEGALLVTSGLDGLFRVWSAQSGEEVARIESDRTIESAIGGGGTLITTGPGGEARAWDLSRKIDPVLERYVGAGARVTFSANGDLVAMAGTPFRSGEDLMAPKKSLAIAADARTGELFDGAYASGVATALDVTADGSRVALASAGRGLCFQPRTTTDNVQLAYEEIVSLAFLGSRLVVLCEGGDAHIWAADSQQELASMSHGASTHALAVCPAANRFAVGGDGTGVSIFSGTAGLMARLDARGAAPPADGRLRVPTLQLAFDPTGQLLAVYDLDQQCWVWDVEGRQVRIRQSFDAGEWLNAMTFSPDGSLTRLRRVSPNPANARQAACASSERATGVPC